MRVLASVIPGTGHLLPLLPSLHALRDAGDTVLVASAEPLRAEVEGAGLDFAAVGPSWHESDADALLPGFRMAGSAGQLGMFAELAPAVVPDLLALADDVRPHLLLREPYEFAAWLAAERSGLPMGTVFNTAVDLLRTIVAGVAALDVEVLVTTGQTVDPAMLGPQPAHVHRGPLRPTTGRAGGGRRRRVPRRGGDGLRRPLGRVPLVVTPLAADQPICAMGCVLAGAAESLAPVPPPREFLAYVTDPTAVTATQVSEATTRVLETPTYRQTAQRIAAEIAAAPAPSSIRPWLTSLTGNG